MESGLDQRDEAAAGFTRQTNPDGAEKKTLDRGCAMITGQGLASRAPFSPALLLGYFASPTSSFPPSPLENETLRASDDLRLPAAGRSRPSQLQRRAAVALSPSTYHVVAVGTAPETAKPAGRHAGAFLATAPRRSPPRAAADGATAACAATARLSQGCHVPGGSTCDLSAGRRAIALRNSASLTSPSPSSSIAWRRASAARARDNHAPRWGRRV